MPDALQLGLSPCPNDTFIFHALLSGLIDAGLSGISGIDPVFADVERLNALALEGALPVSKISAGVAPMILDKYRILDSGAALGWGCGPLLVARETIHPKDLRRATLAVPGAHTAANRLVDLYGEFVGPRKIYVFNEIMDAVASGEVDAGVVIHEGRFTYAERGLKKVLDFGEWWEQNFAMPLPLGLIAIRRDLPGELALAVERAIAASLNFARAHPDASREFIKQHSQELADSVIDAHIAAFVTDFSVSLGCEGKKAIRAFIGAEKNADIFLNN